MSDRQETEACRDNPHLDESAPCEWLAYQIDGRTVIARSPPEGIVELYVVSAVTRNVRSLAQADAVLYEGNIVEPFYDEEIRTIEFQHDYAGKVGRKSVTEQLEHPAVRLKKARSKFLWEVL